MRHDGALTVTKIVEFAYAHRLPAYPGPCVRMHGHTGRLEVEVARDADETYPGIVADFRTLDEVLSAVMAELDHALLDDVINHPRHAAWAREHLDPVTEDGRELYAATSENMLLWTVDRMRALRPGLDLRRVRWWESSSSWAEWRAEK